MDDAVMTDRASDVSSSSSLNSSFRETEDDLNITSILAKEEGSNAALNGNGRLAKSLSHLDSIPYTPRVVGEIPDASEASLDHERLSERLSTYHLEELQIEGDGNCQSRAVADQLFHDSDHHKAVRKEVIKQVCLMGNFTNEKEMTCHCYRIAYRSMERSLTNDEINELQWKVREQVESKLKVVLR